MYGSLTGRTDAATVSIVGDAELADHTPVRIWITTRGLSRDTTYMTAHRNTVEFFDQQSSNDPEVFIFPLRLVLPGEQTLIQPR